jgi:hypothetical protein
MRDENVNIYIVGKVDQTTYGSSNIDNENGQFLKRETQIIALLHDHNLDHFSEMAKLREEACSFGGSWNWQGQQLPLDPIHSQELDTRFHYQATP